MRIDTRRAVLLAALGMAALRAVPVGAQTAPAGTGIAAAGTGTTTTSVGDLRQQLSGLYGLGDGKPEAAGWMVTPSIGLSEGWTSNVGGGTGERHGGFFTAIDPGLLVNADTERLQGTLNYAPTARLYSGVSGQDLFSSNLNANARITLLPEHLFLDLQGYGTVQATSGGVGPSNTVALSRQNATQSYNASATPYLRERFGDAGSGEVGASVAYTSQQNLGNSPAPQGTAGNQDLSSTRQYATFLSGAALGRTQLAAIASATQMNGGGVSRDAHRTLATIDLGYAVSRAVTALVTAGYEDLRYSTVPAYLVDDAVWKVGARLMPNPDSVILARYGHQDGFNAPEFNGAYAISDRVRLFGRYAEHLSSGLEALQDAVSASVLDPLGNWVDPVTGAPLLLTNNFFQVQSNDVLYRVTTASLTLATLFDRDAVSLTLSSQRQKAVGTSLTVPAVDGVVADGVTASNRGTYGSINWQHDLSPTLRTVAFLQYGTTENTGTVGRQTTDLVVASVSLTCSFSETLSGTVQYSYSNQMTGRTGATSLVLVGIRKTF